MKSLTCPGSYHTGSFDLQTKWAPLELLPAELRLHVLEILDLRSLGALVRASRAFHEQYRLKRKTLLLNALQRELGCVTADAYAVHRTRSPQFIKEIRGADNEAEPEFLKQYYKKRHTPGYTLLDEGLVVDEVAAIANFHLSVARPLAEKYLRQTCTEFDKGTADIEYVGDDDLVRRHFGECEVDDDARHRYLAEYDEDRQREERGLYRCELDRILSAGTIQYEAAKKTYAQDKRQQQEEESRQRPPSESEMKRVLRALYRFQLFHALFGVTMKSRISIADAYTLAERHALNFLLEFEPWEANEIAAVDRFAQIAYEKSFYLVRREAGMQLDWWSRRLLVQGLVSSGIELLHTLLCATPEYHCLLTLMQKNTVSFGGTSIRVILYRHTSDLQESYRHPSRRDEQMLRNEPLPFRGDGFDAAGSDGDYPPLAWTIVWRGLYSTMYNTVAATSNMRRWGLIFWDRERMEQKGGTAYLLSALPRNANSNGYNDPRCFDKGRSFTDEEFPLPCSHGYYGWKFGAYDHQ